MKKKILLAVAVLFILGAVVWIWPNFNRDKEVNKIQPPQIISLKVDSGPALKIIPATEKKGKSQTGE